MTHHPLAGVIAKVRRADEHLVSLYNHSVAYVNSTACSLQAQMDVGDGKPGFTLHISSQPPVYLSVIAGDVVHNLRASLDYIAHELIRANNGTPTIRTQFPVSLSEDEFVNEAVTLKRLTGISIKGLKVISAFQPFRLDPGKEKDHPLWLLTKLSNMDKHRTLALSGVGAQSTVTFHHPDGRVFVSEFANAPVQDGAVVASMPADFFHIKLKTHFQGSIGITFTDAPLINREPAGLLQGARNLIGEVIIPAIEPFFDPLPDYLRLTPNPLSSLPR